MSVGQMSVGQMSVDQMSVGQMVFEEKTLDYFNILQVISLHAFRIWVENVSFLVTGSVKFNRKFDFVDEISN